MSGASIARQARQLQKRVAAQLAGKSRGPDSGDGRRVPHRQSYEVSTPKANPWRRIGNGTIAQGMVHREALLSAAREHYHKGWGDCPAVEARAAREAHQALSAELDALQADPAAAPVGRPATVRQEIERLGKIIRRAADRLRRIDITILEAIIRHVDFATGKMFPSIERIADLAGCHRNSVVNALRRLKTHGFIDWVRRTVRTGNEGEFAPQLEQTSNAYFFDHRRMMSARTFARYTQILAAKLRRLGFVPPGITHAPDGTAIIATPALAAAIESFGVSIDNAST